MVELDLPLCRRAGTCAGICRAPGRHRPHRFLLQFLASRIRALTKDRSLQGADAQDRYRRLLAWEGLARLVAMRATFRSSCFRSWICRQTKAVDSYLPA